MGGGRAWLAVRFNLFGIDRSTQIHVWCWTFLSDKLIMSVAGQGFGQKRPPLYHLIKNILREYPSGQVFKVRQKHKSS